MFDVFTRVGDTCEVFDSAVAQVCDCYSDVSHVCVYTMLDSTTALFILSKNPCRSGGSKTVPIAKYSLHN